MSIRWLRQRDTFRCGPVALVNIMKWAVLNEFDGYRVNEKLAKGYLTKLCCDLRPDIMGVYPRKFETVLRRIKGVEVEDVYCQPSRRIIRNTLKNGGIVALHSSYFKNGEEWRHWSLITGVDDQGKIYELINFIVDETVSIVSSTYLSRILNLPDTIAYLLRNTVEKSS